MKLSKYLSLIPLVAVAMLMLQACYKDKGDYDYKDLNKVTLGDTSGLEYSVLQFDTLKLSPDIYASQDVPITRYKFDWTARAIDATVASQHFDTVQLSKDYLFNKQVSLPAGDYRLIFTVTDTATAVSSYLWYTLHVGSNYSRGWMFVEQFANGGDISILAPTGKVFHNIYESSNGVKLPKTLHRVDMNIRMSPKEVFLLSDDQGVEVNVTSFVNIGGFAKWFFNVPATQKPGRNHLVSNTAGQAGVLINNGLIHVKRYGGFPGPYLYGSELTLDNKVEYSAAPYIMDGDFNSSRYIAAFYDNMGKRFIGLRSDAVGIGGNVVHFPTFVAGDAFDANNVGMTLQHAGPSPANYIHSAILKDAAGDSYLFQLNLGVAASPRLKQKMNATGIANMTAAANSVLLEYIYYAEGNRIRMYEIGPNAESLIYTLPAGETVTAMCIDPAISTSTLMVGTYDGTTGRVYEFTLNVNGKFTGDTYVNKYEGFGKIVNMKYKIQ
ncbi:PKD-like family lipoprotein [uncultured Chitinophaga sp.]|uniref:PKD-like family lipoprotein n=1 Tax=uncultured Chitinophaga sp. TaxID=339340 RepID=UPI0025FE9EC3|nr:PKD-like family lipoprotein [uncultured Chitinophaga sp.]